MPTLVIGARYDEMNPDDIRKMGKLLPNSRVAICENGSHLAMWDDQEAYFAALIGFLQDVEDGRFRQSVPDRGTDPRAAIGRSTFLGPRWELPVPVGTETDPAAGRLRVLRG